MLDLKASIFSAMLQCLADAMDSADPEPARLKVYDGTAPETPGGAITDQDLLIEFQCGLPCGSVADGVLTLSATVTGDIPFTVGVATWGRIVDGSGTWIADFDVGGTSSGAWLELSNVNAFQDGIFTATSTEVTLSLSGTGDLHFEADAGGDIQPKAAWSISPEMVPSVTGSAYGCTEIQGVGSGKLGAGEASAKFGVRGVCAGTVPYPSGEATCKTVSKGAASGSIAYPTGSASGEWDSNVFRGPQVQPVSPYSDAAGKTGIPKTHVGVGSPWTLPAGLHPGPRCGWRDGASLPAITTRSPNGALVRCHARPAVAWMPGTPAGAWVASPYVNAWRLHKAYGSQWQPGTRLGLEAVSPFVECWRRHTARYAPWQEATKRGTAPLAIPWIVPRRWKHGTPQVYIPWQDASHPAWIWPIPTEPMPEPPEEPFTGDADFNLLQILPAWAGCIRFDLALAAWLSAVPCTSKTRRYIIVVNSLNLITSDGTVVPCESIEIGTDLDSWTWALQARFKGYAPDALINDQKVLASTLTDTQKAQPWYKESNIDSSGYIWVPKEVTASINDNIWKFVLEGYDTSREFARIQSSVIGRSLSAYLASPYITLRSRIESAARTANQCAEDELYGYGWSLVWDTVDWLISAGALAYESESPMSALKIIADTVGAIIQTHPSEKRITVLPRYAVSTWALASTTPDITIPADVITGMSLRWVPNQVYRGIWVCGREQGVSVRVIRDGTDGDPYLDQVVNQLITHVDAGRERGRNLLCATGKRANVSLTMPLLADPGLILPGKIVLVNQASPWKGYVTGVSVSGTYAVVEQTVEVERIYETP